MNKNNKNTFRLNRRRARIAISPFCNLNCIYCDGPKSRKYNRPGAMEDFRSKSLNQGTINTDTFVKIIEALHKVGFSGITLTGGEPLLNSEWDEIVRKSKAMGMSQICLTTNGVLLNSYSQKNKCLPEELTLLTISFDTFDVEEFKSITRGAKLELIINWLKTAKRNNPRLKIRTNNVVMRRNLKSLAEYVKLCEKSKIIDEINLLNLILKDPRDSHERKNFEKEFVFPSEIIKLLSEKGGYNFLMDSKYEFIASTPKGLLIIVKDTNLTLRNACCNKCPIYCQEGFYTIRVGSDGTIRICMDYKNELPFIDGPKELERGLLVEKLKKNVQMFETVKLRKTLKEFFKRYKIQLKNSPKNILK